MEILIKFFSTMRRRGGPPRAESSMEKFRQALEDCDLHDLGFVGDVFT